MAQPVFTGCLRSFLPDSSIGLVTGSVWRLTPCYTQSLPTTYLP